MSSQTGSSYQASRLIFWLGLALLAGLIYLAVSAWGFGYLGFPLDDAWIHQTYARNLAQSGQLAFTAGAPSAGSTAPLWSLLLSLGYLLRAPLYGWTYGLGVTLLGLTGWSAERLTGRLFPEIKRLGLWVGIFCVLEWHLIWAAVSGMETMLFVWLSLLLLERYLAWVAAESPRQMLWLGLIGGLLILTRPEGVGLVGLIGLDLARRWFQQPGPRQPARLLRLWGAIIVGAALPVLPYVLFHLSLTGRPFPNTLYAKQAEYGVILSSYPLWQRLFGGFGPSVDSVQGVFRVIFIGPQLLLLPGLIYAAWLTVAERRWALGPAWIWWISYLLLYGLRLPVTYQHGRYQMPVIVWVVLLGVWGTARLMQRLRRTRTVGGRVLATSLAGSLAALLLAFVVVGAQTYSRDVRIIETEMVATARWLAQHTEADTLIAAHDIGAIGYFAPRPLIDLAGLVTPAVIPIIRDEAALLQFVIDQKAAYLMTFPSWYPAMTASPHLQPVFSTDAPYAPRAGGDNMTVYRVVGQ